MSWRALEQWFHDLMHDDDPDTCQATVHSVEAGDSLRKMAKIRWGDEERYKDIVEANPGRQWDDEYHIYVGEKLRLPKSWTH